MSDFPLRKLPANDPENLLSPEARQRIQRMYIQVDRIKLQAEHQAVLRYEAEADRGRSFDEFVSSGQTSIDLANAKMEAARECLRVVQKEFQELGLPDRKLDQIVQEWLESVANSLELSMLDRELLGSEIICARLER
jgi:hypothetical protein